jgi:hypothetical protein
MKEYIKEEDIKDWWLNIYNYDHDPCKYRHEIRELAKKKSMFDRNLLYR